MVNQQLDHVRIKVKTKFKKTEGKETIIQFSTNNPLIHVLNM
jgi:hypothetical protein